VWRAWFSVAASVLKPENEGDYSMSGDTPVLQKRANHDWLGVLLGTILFISIGAAVVIQLISG
jgi:hypothetical protein